MRKGLNLTGEYNKIRPQIPDRQVWFLAGYSFFFFNSNFELQAQIYYSIENPITYEVIYWDISMLLRCLLDINHINFGLYV